MTEALKNLKVMPGYPTPSKYGALEMTQSSQEKSSATELWFKSLRC